MKLNSIYILLILLFVVSCSDREVITTKSGLKVQMINDVDSEKPEDGQIMTLNMTYRDAEGKEMFNTTDRGEPVPIQYVDSVWKNSGIFYEAMSLLTIGDSISFSLNAEEFFKNTFKVEVPDTIDKDTDISFNIGLVDAMSRNQYAEYRNKLYTERREKIFAEKLVEDGAAIDQFLEDNDIEAIKTESGLRYIITEEGDGPKPEEGQTVVVHYNGELLDGTKFDSSYDNGKPFSFVLGQGRVIKGWDEGIALLNKGDKATLFVPSPLGYGGRQAGEVIKPYSILKFDVELIDIKD
ncbi:MAG TPA: FKBP-type peptidyl-prolyl cis-trans isomerase [Cyclobacteriaceae bacterium]